MHEFGQIPDVIEMAVRDDDRIDLCRRNRQRHVVERTYVDDALKETAIDEDAAPVEGQQMFAAGDRASRADERQLGIARRDHERVSWVTAGRRSS